MQIDGTITIGMLVATSMTVVLSLWAGAWALVTLVGKQFTKRVEEKFDAITRQVEDQKQLTRDGLRSVNEKMASNMESSDHKIASIRTDMHSLEREMLNLKNEISDRYERRNDAIRREVSIVSRLEGLAALIREVRKP
jgi:hypothetical protein